MVDLNRQIRATQARQGGFSAHVLPGPVEYAPFGFFEFKPRLVNSKWLLDGPTLGAGYELVEFSSNADTDDRFAIEDSLLRIRLARDPNNPNLDGASISAGIGVKPFIPGLGSTVWTEEVIQSLPDLSAPSRPGATIEGWFVQPTSTTAFGSGIGVQWFYVVAPANATTTTTPGTVFQISVGRNNAGIAVARFFVNTVSEDQVEASIAESSSPVHLRAVVADNLVTLALNGSQVASRTFGSPITISPCNSFRVSLGTNSAISIGKVGGLKLHYTALERTGFTPPPLA
jgi:hypothetical protein